MSWDQEIQNCQLLYTPLSTNLKLKQQNLTYSQALVNYYHFFTKTVSFHRLVGQHKAAHLLLFHCRFVLYIAILFTESTNHVNLRRDGWDGVLRVMGLTLVLSGCFRTPQNPHLTNLGLHAAGLKCLHLPHKQSLGQSMCFTL